MKKVRIAIWGISDGILNAIIEEINPFNTEIVLFFDNDETKHGICYRDIPIMPPSKQLVCENAVDYILVTALSAYEEIKEQLIVMGIEKEKIQVFVAKDIKRYCVGNIDDIDVNLIKTIYFEPQKVMNIVTEYRTIFNIYSKIPACEESMGEWYYKGRMISHACGGIVNGKRMIYSNSKEAFEYSVKKKFKLIECDLTCLYNGELVLLHDWERCWELEEKQYSMMTAKDLFMLLKEHREMSCLIDTKWKDYDEYFLLVNEIDRLIETICDDSNERGALKGQVIMEVYDEETIKIAKEKDFNMIFTQYRNPQWPYFMNTVILCHKYGVKVIAMPVYVCLEWKKLIRIFTDKNIKIFAFSTDSVDEYSALRKMNVTGIFTNYLAECELTGI